MAIRILHIIVAMITLVSSTGVVLNEHYCQGKLKNAALFVKPESCHSSAKMTACPRHHQDDEDKDCCSNFADYVKLKQDQQISSLDLQVPAPPQPVAVAVSIPAELFPSNTQLWPSYLSFKPPIVEPDIWLKLETILC